MSTAAHRVCIEVLSLPEDSRAEIAERILASLEPKSDTNADRAWKSLVRKRRAEIRSGKTKLRSADAVMRAALKSLERRVIGGIA